MTALEKKRAELQLSRVRVARQELEFNLFERQEDITRIQGQIKQQLEAEAKLGAQITEANKEK